MRCPLSYAGQLPDGGGPGFRFALSELVHLRPLTSQHLGAILLRAVLLAI